MPGSFTSLHYHIAFSTKDRRPFLTPEIAPGVFDYLGGIVRAMEGTPIIVGGAADHAHVLGSIGKTVAVADAVRNLKASSSKWVHETLGVREFGWQEGYAAFSISVSGLDRVRAYVANQEEHHRTVSFQEEFLSFLRRHGIPYDERYIWG